MSENNEMIYMINQARIDARSDNIRGFFKKNFRLFTKLIIAFILLLVGFFAYNSYQKSQQEKFSEILHQSLIYQQSNEMEKAKESLKKIYEAKTAPKGVKALASLRYAAFLLQEEKRSEAIKVYADVVKCGSCDNYIHDLAALLMVKLWMADEAEVNKDDLVSRIKKIEDGAKVLKYQITEQRAILELQKNHLEEAYKAFDLIAQSPEGSPAVKERAKDGIKMVIEKGFVPKV